MNKTLFPFLPNDFHSKDPHPNIFSHFQATSPGQFIKSSSELDLFKKSSDYSQSLIYMSKTLINPLSRMPLFQDILDESLNSKICLSSTQDLLSFYKIRIEEEEKLLSITKNDLQFNSNFEGGNLYKAYKHGINEYVLLLRPDFGNEKYVHWFYYKVRPKVSEKIRFHIININKEDLGLMKGMKIVIKKDEL